MSVTHTAHTLSFSIPLSMLDNDDGLINIATIAGDYDGPTDWAPEVGYGTIRKTFYQYLPILMKDIS